MSKRPALSRNKMHCALLAALAFGAFSAGAAEPEWDPAKTWTIDAAEDMPQRGTQYYGANCQTGSSTSSPTGDVSGYRTIVTADGVSIPPKGLTGAYTNEGLASNNRLEIAAGTVVSHGGTMLSLHLSGARTQKGDAVGNTFVFNGEAERTVVMAGGYSNSGNANGNTLTFGSSAKANGGSVSLHGGWAFGLV